MTPSATPHLSIFHRFPGERICHAVWLYCRFPLRHRDGEARLVVRGVSVSSDAIRQRCRQCGQAHAN
jgi:putative transposase